MKRLWFIGESAVLAAADQSLKSYARENIKPGEEKPLTKHIVLRNVRNRGLFLNLLQEKPGVVKKLSLASALALTAAQGAALAGKGHFFRKNALALLLAGAWSNTFDRIAGDGVTDYIGVKSGGKKLSEITYNLADFYILAGNAILALTSIFPAGKRKNTKKRENVVS